MREKDISFHDWLVRYIERKFKKDYKELKANVGEKRFGFKGYYPDLILATHGVIVSLVEVETEETINPERTSYWKELSSLGPKLVLMVPVHLKTQVLDLLWKESLTEKISIATYELVIRM